MRSRPFDEARFLRFFQTLDEHQARLCAAERALTPGLGGITYLRPKRIVIQILVVIILVRRVIPDIAHGLNGLGCPGSVSRVFKIQANWQRFGSLRE